MSHVNKQACLLWDLYSYDVWLVLFCLSGSAGDLLTIALVVVASVLVGVDNELLNRDVKAEIAEHSHSDLIGLDGTLGLGDGSIGHHIGTTSLLGLLKGKRDTADGSSLNALHQVGHETADLVAETLGGDLSDLLADLLVDLEVSGQLGVVVLHNLATSALHSLSTNTALNRKQYIYKHKR